MSSIYLDPSSLVNRDTTPISAQPRTLTDGTTLDPQIPTSLGDGGSVVPGAMQLGRNPMLPQHPLGAYTDSQYEADDAMLRSQVAKRYADLLQQLGYRDDQGNFIQGSVETEGNKQMSELAHGQALAAQDVTNRAQNEGTLFSGIRGTLQARAEDPFVRSRASLMSSVPLSIQQLYENAAGLSGDYVLGQNQLLASAAARRAARLMVDPSSGAVIPSGGGGGTAAPAPAPAPAPTSPQGYPLQPDGSVLTSDITTPEAIPPDSTFGNGSTLDNYASAPAPVPVTDPGTILQPGTAYVAPEPAPAPAPAPAPILSPYAAPASAPTPYTDPNPLVTYPTLIKQPGQAVAY